MSEQLKQDHFKVAVTQKRIASNIWLDVGHRSIRKINL